MAALYAPVFIVGMTTPVQKHTMSYCALLCPTVVLPFFTPLSKAALFIHHLILYILKRVSITVTAGKLVNVLASYVPAYGNAFSYANQRGAFVFLYGSWNFVQLCS